MKYLSTFGLAALLVACPPSHAIMVSISPTSQSATAGSQVHANLVVSGLGDRATPSLGTFDVNVGFDPAILSFISADFGNQLDILGLGSIQTVTRGIGVFVLFELSLDQPSDLDTLQKGSFTLASLNFNALAAGTSALRISIIALGDSMGNPLVADSVNGNVNVTAVPEPSSYLLMGVGFLGLVLIRRQSTWPRADAI